MQTNPGNITLQSNEEYVYVNGGYRLVPSIQTHKGDMPLDEGKEATNSLKIKKSN